MSHHFYREARKEGEFTSRTHTHEGDEKVKKQYLCPMWHVGRDCGDGGRWGESGSNPLSLDSFLLTYV